MHSEPGSWRIEMNNTHIHIFLAFILQQVERGKYTSVLSTSSPGWYLAGQPRCQAGEMQWSPGEEGSPPASSSSLPLL